MTDGDGIAPVAVVTGAASGIGAAIAAELCDRGWQVAGLDLRPSGWHLSLVVDVTDPDAVQQAVRSAAQQLGPVHAAVSAAGHYAIVPVAEISASDWLRMLRVHLGGFMNVVHACAPAMVERGSGSIVAITSELAIGGGSGDSHYAAAKGAIIGAVRSLGAELAPRGLRVNAVAPGPTDTPLLPVDSPWRELAYLSTLPAGRLAAPEEIARTVAFVIEDADFMVGEIVSPNSGAVI